MSIRNRAIIELFYACGIRTSVLCSLRIQDVDLKEQNMTIVARGRVAIINNEPPAQDDAADQLLRGPAGRILADLADPLTEHNT